MASEDLEGIQNGRGQGEADHGRAREVNKETELAMKQGCSDVRLEGPLAVVRGKVGSRAGCRATR